MPKDTKKTLLDDFIGEIKYCFVKTEPLVVIRKTQKSIEFFEPGILDGDVYTFPKGNLVVYRAPSGLEWEYGDDPCKIDYGEGEKVVIINPRYLLINEKVAGKAVDIKIAPESDFITPKLNIDLV